MTTGDAFADDFECLDCLMHAPLDVHGRCSRCGLNRAVCRVFRRHVSSEICAVNRPGPRDPFPYC